MATQSISERFWANVDTSGGPDACWPWLKSVRGKGYGQATFNGKQYAATRVLFMIQGVELAKGICVCHRCDNPICVNPAHLFLGTTKDNVADMIAKGRANHSNPAKGEGHGKSKLTEADVRAIRDDKRSQRVIGAEYRIAPTHVGRIRRREFWAHLT